MMTTEMAMREIRRLQDENGYLRWRTRRAEQNLDAATRDFAEQLAEAAAENTRLSKEIDSVFDSMAKIDAIFSGADHER